MASVPQAQLTDPKTAEHIAAVLQSGAQRVGVVRPGDCLRMEIEMLQARRSTMKYAGKCYVKDNLVCEAELMAMIGKK